ncbi:hypothetical protein NQ315_007052 [Exocentrus adspersus]|uniref:Uncharacterized protein n=1 Tax=Exocentrus adspersus TaxID=1586481 RepID=A0AAV8WDW5_9CUCU|nr:hypothetical protein NQ315_007052 [Exocentrus adspersus]
MDHRIKVILLLALASADAGVLPAVEVLEGPSSKTTIVGPDGSKIQAFAPGGKIVLNDNLGPVLQGAPEVITVEGVPQGAPGVDAIDGSQPPEVVPITEDASRIPEQIPEVIAGSQLPEQIPGAVAGSQLPEQISEVFGGSQLPEQIPGAVAGSQLPEQIPGVVPEAVQVPQAAAEVVSEPQAVPDLVPIEDAEEVTAVVAEIKPVPGASPAPVNELFDEGVSELPKNGIVEASSVSLELTEGTTVDDIDEEVTETPFRVVPLVEATGSINVRSADAKGVAQRISVPQPVISYIHDSPLYVPEASQFDGRYLPENLSEDDALGW